MAEVTRIHKGKQPNRPHFIEDWAVHRNFRTQIELANALEADKSVISRWYGGSTPSLDWQLKLAALFEIEREALFRHPDDDWIAKFFQGRSQEERERAKKMLEVAFPRKTGTDG
jgi:DNA-binding XRE family transcriptional regulator